MNVDIAQIIQIEIKSYVLHKSVDNSTFDEASKRKLIKSRTTKKRKKTMSWTWKKYLMQKKEEKNKTPKYRDSQIKSRAPSLLQVRFRILAPHPSDTIFLYEWVWIPPDSFQPRI